MDRFPLGFPAVIFRPDGLCELVVSTAYITGDGERIDVPAGRVTDLESRPTILPAAINGILGPLRETAPAAIIHDELCITPNYTRKRADIIYWEILLYLKDIDPKSSKLEKIRRRVGATVAWVGLRTYCWLFWKK